MHSPYSVEANLNVLVRRQFRDERKLSYLGRCPPELEDDCKTGEVDDLVGRRIAAATKALMPDEEKGACSRRYSEQVEYLPPAILEARLVRPQPK